MPSTTRLHRIREGRLLGGVCAGLARELGVDLAIVRVVTVLLALIGVGGLAYIVLVLFVPEEGQDTPLVNKAIDGEQRPLAIGLTALALIGIVSFDGPLGWLPGPGWPVLLLSAGGVALAFGLSRRDAAASSPGGSEAVASSRPAGSNFASEAPTVVAGPENPAPASATPSTSPKRHAGVAAAIALGAALLAFAVAGGVLLLADVGVGWDVVLACSVIAVGAMLLVAAPFGGARALIPLGFALAAVSGVAAAADLKLEGGVGEQHFRPATYAAVQDDYKLSAGSLVIDLRDVRFPAGATHIDAQVGFGELIVRVPDGTPVHAGTHAAGGELRTFGEVADGLDADQDVDSRGTGPSTSSRLDLDIEMGFGQVTVVRGDDPIPGHDTGDAGIVTPAAWR